MNDFFVRFQKFCSTAKKIAYHLFMYFGKPDKKQFQEIVRTLAARYGVTMPEEELLLKANQWEISHGGLTGRAAQQFIDYIVGTEEEKKK